MAIKISGTTIINDETSFVSLAGTGALKLPVGTTAQGGAISAAAGMIRFNSDDTVFEAYNGTAWGDVHTSTGDATFTGTSYNVVWDASADALEFGDSAKAVFGTGGDLEIYHQGHTYINNNNTSDLTIRNSASDYDVKIQSDNGSGGIANYFVADGSVGAAEMHWGDYSTNSGADGGVKLATNASGVTITGTATATAFSGDGSALTNLPASADEYARTIALLGL